jgi:hypothetical protein
VISFQSILLCVVTFIKNRSRYYKRKWQNLCIIELYFTQWGFMLMSNQSGCDICVFYLIFNRYFGFFLVSTVVCSGSISKTYRFWLESHFSLKMWESELKIGQG